MEKFGRDSNISLSFANINAMHFFLGLRVFKTKRGKDINETLPFSSFQRIKPGNFQFCISKTTSARGCKLSKHEKILPYSIFGTLHRRRFHLSLARKLTSSFTRSCNWEEFDVLRLTWLFVCIFFSVKLQFNRTCRKLTYLCTLSSRRNANYVSHNTVSPRCTSWKSEKQRKLSW